MLVCIGFLAFIIGACTPPTPAPTQTQATKPSLYPPIDRTRLLTNQEMETLADPGAPTEPLDVRTWIQGNHYTIRSLVVDNNFADLQFFKQFLGSKRLVQLGESGHGVREFNMAKTRLIKFLHEEMGYDVIAFESSLFDCYDADQRATSFSTPLEMMQSSIFAVWSTIEVEELFRYIRSTKNTPRPLILAGFDSQRSAGRDPLRRSRFFRNVLRGVDSGFAERAEVHDSSFISLLTTVTSLAASEAAIKRIQTEEKSWIAMYDSIAQFCEQHKGRITAQANGNAVLPLFVAQCARSGREYVRQYANADNLSVGIPIRDKAMAENIDFLLKTMYADKKIIVWAHNFHIRHANSQTTTNNEAGVKTQGEFLVELGRRSDMYTIGLIGYRGQAATNNRQLYSFSAATLGSIESIAYNARKHYMFFDMTSQERTSATSWMFEKRVYKEWGVNPMLGIWRDQYDGFLYVDAVNPPSYY